jgi:hypothetical protein
LQSSPGEDFTGQIRINFAQAGTSSQRYGSFSRMVRAAYAGAPEAMGVAASVYDPVEDYEGDNSPGDLQGAPTPLGAMNLGMGGFGGHMGMPMPPQGTINQEEARQWVETSMNFAFRAMAQQQQMFDRALGLVESLHFGFTRQPPEPGIVEQRGGGGGGESPGLLGMLVNTAAQLAKAETPGGRRQRGEATERRSRARPR